MWCSHVQGENKIMNISTETVAKVILVLVVLGILVGGAIFNANTNVKKMDDSTNKMYDSIVVGSGN